MSSATLARWRRLGVVPTAAAVLRLAALATDRRRPVGALALARVLAGLSRRRKIGANRPMQNRL